MIRKRYFIIVFIIFAAILLVPFPTTLAPEWKLRVVNENGTPYVENFVRQFCYDYSLDFREYRDAESDSDGYVTFPKVTIWMSAGMRVARTASAYVLQIAHGSMGQSVSVDSRGRRLVYDGKGAPPSELILPSEPDDK